VDMWSKAQVCSCLIAGIMGSNPAEGTDIHLVFVACCVGSGFCDWLITCYEKSNWVHVCA